MVGRSRLKLIFQKLGDRVVFRFGDEFTMFRMLQERERVFRVERCRSTCCDTIIQKDFGRSVQLPYDCLRAWIRYLFEDDFYCFYETPHIANVHTTETCEKSRQTTHGIRID